MIKPMLATLSKLPFNNKEWLFETKWDGFRAIAEVKGKKISLYSRTFHSFDEKFKPVVEEFAKFNLHAIFDGEIVVIEKGISSFQELQNYQRTGAGDLRYCIFDLLSYKGKDLRNEPLIKRKELLKKILPLSEILYYSEHVLEQGKELFKVAEKEHLEGIIGKKINSPYVSKRSSDWLKFKTLNRQEVVICGFTEPKGSRKDLGALIVGVYENGEYRYAGHVGGGFNQKSLRETKEKLKPFITDKSPFSVTPKTNTQVTWVKPKLLCEVKFAEWTKEGIMRQPIFQGLREDKSPKQVVAEDLILTHLDKVFWPNEGITKGDLIDYYREVSPFILPYLKDRPESLRRYPNGIDSPSFFQKNIGEHIPAWIPTTWVEHGGTKIHYLVIQDVKSLLFAINLGCIDLNPFNSRIKNLENPDYLIIDLDPEDISFDKVIETAQAVHSYLEEYEIDNYCKTSGATGLHIYIPLNGKYTYEQTKLFAELLVTQIHGRIPSFTSILRKPVQRKKKVYLDFLQNNFGQTLATPYSVRAMPKAPVSTPLEWSEVVKGLKPTDFTIKNVLKRFEKKGDIFLPVLKKGVNFEKVLKRIQA